MPYLTPRPESIKLDANGNGQVTFSIDNTNLRWVIDQVHVLTNQALNSTPVPTAQVYKNQVGQQFSEGGTYSGVLDTATGRVILYPDDTLYVVWSGGVPASTATAIISGTFDPAGVPIQD